MITIKPEVVDYLSELGVRTWVGSLHEGSL